MIITTQVVGTDIFKSCITPLSDSDYDYLAPRGKSAKLVIFLQDIEMREIYGFRLGMLEHEEALFTIYEYTNLEDFKNYINEIVDLFQTSQ